MNPYALKIANLQDALKDENLDAYIVLSSDPHSSEYLPEYWKDRAFLSGFKGSVGTLIVTQTKAMLFIDGRYILQAKKELKGTNIDISFQNTPTFYANWLVENVDNEANIGINDRVLSLSVENTLKECFSVKSIKLRYSNTVDRIYTKRPPLPSEKIFEHHHTFCGLDRIQKLHAIREKMNDVNATHHLICSLDDIAWITNLRGKDVSYNPVFLAFLLISHDDAYLFTDTKKIDSLLQDKLLHDGFIIKEYTDIDEHLHALKDARVLIDPIKTNVYLLNLFRDNCKIIEQTNPSTFLKAVKTSKEIKLIKQAMISDGVALCHFFAWLEWALKRDISISELDIDSKLTEFRAKHKLYMGNSFNTIAGFNANGALPHYSANQENFSYINGNGLLLIDSGGQYQNGTTDITRVTGIRNVSNAQKRDYTLVLKALIAMSEALFPQDMSPTLLDSIGRIKLWSEQIDYKHGTGHGVGYFLNVHEGPQTLSCYSTSSKDNIFKPQMINSIEPGIYREGKWGVRLENLVMVTKPKQRNEFGIFLGFETLTLCPFEQKCINTSLLDEHEKKWINKYHKKVFKALAPKLKGKALSWLKRNTKEIR